MARQIRLCVFESTQLICMLRSLILPCIMACFTQSSFAQVNELENFRKKFATFVLYDQGKIDSLPKEESRTARLRKELEDLFILFVRNKETHNLESLKAQSKIRTGGTFYFDKQGYHLSERYRDLTRRNEPDQRDYYIGFYGLYDYKLPNFAGMYIQPFLVGNQKFIVYSYSMNKEGQYFIKDSASNEVLYQGRCLTSEPPIVRFRKIDNEHVLLVENMDVWGQRAIVLKKSGKSWSSIQAFTGKAFAEGTTEFKQKTLKNKRQYMWLASTRSLNTHYGSRYLTLDFDEKTKQLVYSHVKGFSDFSLIQVTAAWKNHVFDMDDYFLGEHIDDSPVPMPD